MGARVLLVAWKGSTATAWVQPLIESGYTVLLEDTTGERAWRTAKERGIDVVIIDGQKKPSHGRQTGHALRDTAKTRDIPIIWTNLEQEDTGAVQDEVKPDVTLVAPTDAFGTLAALRALSRTNRWQNGELFAKAASDSRPAEIEALPKSSLPALLNGPAPAPIAAAEPEPSLPPAPPPQIRPDKKAAPARREGHATKKSAPQKTAARKATARTPPARPAPKARKAPVKKRPDKKLQGKKRR